MDRTTRKRSPCVLGCASISLLMLILLMVCVVTGYLARRPVTVSVEISDGQVTMNPSKLWPRGPFGLFAQGREITFSISNRSQDSHTIIITGDFLSSTTEQDGRVVVSDGYSPESLAAPGSAPGGRASDDESYGIICGIDPLPTAWTLAAGEQQTVTVTSRNMMDCAVILTCIRDEHLDRDEYAVLVVPE